jgi:hypothetical protein
LPNGQQRFHGPVDRATRKRLRLLISGQEYPPSESRRRCMMMMAESELDRRLSRNDETERDGERLLRKGAR